MNAGVIENFAAALRVLDELDLQVDGRVWVPDAGWMDVAYDGVTNRNEASNFVVD